MCDRLGRKGLFRELNHHPIANAYDGLVHEVNGRHVSFDEFQTLAAQYADREEALSIKMSYYIFGRITGENPHGSELYTSTLNIFKKKNRFTVTDVINGVTMTEMKSDDIIPGAAIEIFSKNFPYFERPDYIIRIDALEREGFHHAADLREGDLLVAANLFEHTVIFQDLGLGELLSYSVAEDGAFNPVTQVAIYRPEENAAITRIIAPSTIAERKVLSGAYTGFPDGVMDLSQGWSLTKYLSIKESGERSGAGNGYEQYTRRCVVSKTFVALELQVEKSNIGRKKYYTLAFTSEFPEDKLDGAAVILYFEGEIRISFQRSGDFWKTVLEIDKDVLAAIRRTSALRLEMKNQNERLDVRVPMTGSSNAVKQLDNCI